MLKSIVMFSQKHLTNCQSSQTISAENGDFMELTLEADAAYIITRAYIDVTTDNTVSRFTFCEWNTKHSTGLHKNSFMQGSVH